MDIRLKQDMKVLLCIRYVRKIYQGFKGCSCKAVETADITVDDVHFANTNAIVNIENEIEDGAVRIQKYG